MATDGFVRRWNNVQYNASAERLLDSLLMMPGPGSEPFSARAGRRPNGSGLAVSVGGSPEAVTVTPGSALVYDSAVSAAGPYLINIPTAVSVPLPARPGSGTSRIDLIVARVYDADVGLGSVQELKIERVQGDPSSTPVEKTKPTNSLILARLTVPSSGSITVTPSTDRTVAAGGVLPVATTSVRDALSAYSGLTVYNEQTKRLEVFDGTSWTAAAGSSPTRILRRTSNSTVASGNNVLLGAGWSPQPGDGGDASGLTYANGIATIGTAGLYYVSVRFVVPAITSGTWTVGIVVNGASDPLADLNLYDQEGRGTNLSYTAHLPFAAGDALQVFIRQVSGSSQSLSATTSPSRWEIRRVGDA